MEADRHLEHRRLDLAHAAEAPHQFLEGKWAAVGDGDGIGDLKGLIQKLDYINDGVKGGHHSLGARCIWLMPVAESPSYHGYDVTNYYRVNPDYGTNDDFKKLIAESHRRGIKVLVDSSATRPHDWLHPLTVTGTSSFVVPCAGETERTWGTGFATTLNAPASTPVQSLGSMTATS